MPDPILDLILRRKSAKTKLSARNNYQPITMASPAVSSLAPTDDEIMGAKSEVEDINKRLLELGFSNPDDVESKIGDLPDNTPGHLVFDVLNISNPTDLLRKKAAIKWAAPIARTIDGIPDPSNRKKAQEEMSWIQDGLMGGDDSNYETAYNATKAAVDIIKKYNGSGDINDMLKNLRIDSEYGLAKTLLKDPAAQKRWESLGLNPVQGVALDIKELFEPNGAEFKKQISLKTDLPEAVSEQNFKKAELERYGYSILGNEIDYQLEKNKDKVGKANAYYNENKKKLDELEQAISKDSNLTEEMKTPLLGYKKKYEETLEGREGNLITSPFTFEGLKSKMDANTATPYEIRQYNKMVGKLNGLTSQYKSQFDNYEQTAAEQNAAVREYNKIVNTIKDTYEGVDHSEKLSAWAEYLAKQRNTLGDRYPEYKQQELEGLVKDLAGDNVGLGEKTAFRLAQSIGGEAIDGVRKVWNNLTIWDGDKLRETEMGDAYRRRVEDVIFNYETGDQMLKDERSVIPVVPKDVQDQLNAIKNSNMSDEDKYQANYDIVSKAFDGKKIQYVSNPKYGKYNITADSILNTISNVSSQFIGQMIQSYLSGGFSNASKLRRLTTLFGTTAAQTFSREYDASVQRGDSNPFEQAITKSFIEGVSELPFDNIEFVKKLSPQFRKVAGDMSQAEWAALRSGKMPSNLGREFVNAIESVAKEGVLEEGLAQVGGNTADKYLFGKDKDITEGLEVAMLAGTIGFAPMSLIGLPFKYRSANMGNKLMMYQAGYKADQVINAINQQLADGGITAEEAKQRIESVKLMKEVVGKMSMYDANGKPLTDNQKAQYAWNEYTKLKAKNIEGLPEQQKQEVEQVVKEADQSSSNILNGTDNATYESQRPMQGMPAEGNLQQPQAVEQGQQEAGQATQPTANVSYSDSSSQEVDIADVPQGLTEVETKVVDDAIQTAKSLAPAGIKVRVFKNQEDFERESAKLGQQARGQGVFMATGKEVLINLSKIKNANDWGIVWHEGTHPVMNIIRNTNPELYNNMAKGFGKLAKQGGVFAQVQKWATSDYGNNTDETTDEAMVETVSLLGDGKIALQDIPTSFRQQVIDFVNKIADYLGLGQLADTSERVFVQKAAQIAQALRSGESIGTVVGEENVFRTENPFIGQEKKGAVQDTTPKPKDFKAAEAEVKDLIEQQKSQPEAVLIEPQREKDGKLKITVEYDEDGNRSVEIKYKQAPYDLKKGALQYVNKDEEKAAEILSDNIVADYKANEARPEIAAGIGWYSKMRQRFQKYFGANIETFGQLLAATSARTGVFDNFKQSVEAFRLFSQGKYNGLLEDYDKFVKDIQSKTDEQLFTEWQEENPNKKPREFKANEYRVKRINRYDKFPLKANGKKYNANSKKVLQALYGNWLQQTEGPKTKNFAGNLTGRSFGPTIDVWAARYLRRLIYQGKVDRWRIPPSLEKGVDYSILVSGEMSGDYPFAEKVMQKAADKLGINADDLQAFLWYLEKDVWDKNGWTNKAGAEKASFEQGADTLDTERYQAGVTTYKDAATFDPVKYEQERIALQNEIGSLPGVIAARVNESIGEFYSETEGIYIEPTFDVEFTVEKGSDVTPVRERVEKILKDYKQDATLFSKFVDADHPNARPIIEIGLSEPTEKSQIIDDVKDMLVKDNVRGFTIAKDARGRILGVRTQFIPEFEGVSVEDGIKRFVNAFQKIKEKYGKDRNISYIATGSVDTQVKFQEDGKETQQNDGAGDAERSVPQQLQQPEGGQIPGGQSERNNEGGSGAAGGMGQESDPGQQRRSAAVESEVADIVANAKANGTYLKAPNGKDTKLTPDQWATTRTQNFKNWFGDWENDPTNASKVVDENGEPLVVYHGSKSPERIDEFKPDTDSSNFNTVGDPKGFYFGSNNQYIYGFAKNRETREKGTMYMAFLNIRNPLMVGDALRANGKKPLSKRRPYSEAKREEYKRFDPEVNDGYINDFNSFQNEYIAIQPNQIKSANNNSGNFSTSSNKIQERRTSIEDINTAIQERKSAAKITSKAIDSMTDLVTKLGYGYLPEDVREKLKKKQRLIDADLNEMNVLSQRLEDEIKKAYGVSYKKLDDKTLELFDNALRNFPGLNLRQKAAQAKKIPDPILSILDSMRASVDSMSLKLIEIGVLDDSLEPAFDGEKGLGTYLTRTYRKYDDPEWVTKIPEPVRNRAIQYLKANNFVREFDAMGNEIGERELTDEEIDGLVNYIATNMQPVNEGLSSANLGKTKVDILKGRKEIPQEIRDLMGEYKDPMVNFARSIAKMASLVHTHQALKAIAEENMGTLFFDRPTGENYVPVAGEGKNYLQPLSGLYTTPEIAEAFKTVQANLDGNDVNLRFLRMLAGINGIVKVGKTALSPASWVRNVIGGHIIMMKDGHLFGDGYTDGWKKAIGYFANKSKDDPAFQAKMREYIEQGILGDGVQAGEFQAIIKAAQKHEDPIEWLKSDSKLGKIVSGVKGFYSAQDDIFRVWAYENEKARLKKRKPNMTEEQLNAEASRKARATYPTYSELPEVIRQLAKFIPISSFPAFSAELIRTTKNSFKIAIEEIRDPEMRDVGFKRLGGVISAISFGSILSGLSAMLVGVDDEEEKAIRRYFPEWSKNSPVIWLGRDDNGLPKYIDLGFSDPFSYFKKPVVALANEDNEMSDRIKSAVGEVAAPFVSPEIFLSAMVKGTKKLKETDDLDEVMGKYAGPVYEALEPGLVASLRRIGKGMMGDVDRYGQQYDAGLELLAFFSGQRIKKMDVPVGFSFKGKEFVSAKRDIMGDYYIEKAKTNGDPEKQAEELADANVKVEKYFNELKKDYDAALVLMTRNMTDREARKILKNTMKDRNVPNDFIKAIEKGTEYPKIEDDK